MLKKINLSGAMSFFKNVMSEKNLNILRNFFMGKWYPVWVAFSVLIGRITCLELYFAMFDFVVMAMALLLCDSIRPILPNLITFLFRIPLEHSPGVPYYSTYYADTRIIPFAIFAAIFLAALVYFYIKNKVFVGVNILKTPLFIPLSLFSLSFLTAGIFSENRAKEDFGFSLLQVLVFFVVYLILYYGLRRENIEDLLDYFAYIGAMCAIVLSLEVFDLYLRVDGVIVNGIINKTRILFGWGISNTCGNALSMMAPLCILGAMRAKKIYSAVAYYGIGGISLIAMAMTLSRSALLVGVVGFIMCMITACFAGKQKVFCRIAMLGAAVFALLVIIVFKTQISHLFQNLVSMGFGDNGRYHIWRVALKHYKDNPWFGNGHFALNTGVVNSTFTPRLAHCTIIQILTAMGRFGLISYIIYRVCTIIPFIKRFTGTKFILMVLCGILVAESLIDNFIFWFSPTFAYNICIILAIMHCQQSKSSKKNSDDKNADDPLEDPADDNDASKADDQITDDTALAPNENPVPDKGIIHDSPIIDATVSNITL